MYMTVGMQLGWRGGVPVLGGSQILKTVGMQLIETRLEMVNVLILVIL